MRSIFFDHIGQLSFERQSLVNLLSLASTTNIPFGMLRRVTGMTTTGITGTAGLIGYMHIKIYSLGIMCTYMDAVGCMDEFF
jgi:hypothetical protein